MAEQDSKKDINYYGNIDFYRSKKNEIESLIQDIGGDGMLSATKCIFNN